VLFQLTAALSPILRQWASVQRDEASRSYGIVAPNVDFAMQALDKVIDAGRAVTARMLDLNPRVRRD
jgi:hypothetical protein